MANNVMYPLSKLISQSKSKKKFYLLIGLLSIAGILLTFTLSDSCVYKHASILGKMSDLEKNFDPVTCEIILDRIIIFNDECEPEIEIMDCG